jgi:hypothetical protein
LLPSSELKNKINEETNMKQVASTALLRFQRTTQSYISEDRTLHNQKQNSVALVRMRTILTERPPHVGEVNANFSG